PKNFFDLAHRQPLCWHSVSSNKGAKPYQRLPSAASKPPGIPGSCPRFRDVVHHSEESGKVVIIASESVDTFDRNGWSTSIGMGGQDGPEYATRSAGEAAARNHDSVRRVRTIVGLMPLVRFCDSDSSGRASRSSSALIYC